MTEKSNINRNASHDPMISMAKAVCIILMVVGHSGAPTKLGQFIYLFHMPCFFFLSGYLLKVKYFDSPKSYLTKRVKGYYWPFVKWSMIFLMLHGIFFRFGFYQNDYSLSDYIRKIFGILTMTGSEQLLGGYWFLKELLFASIISFVVIKICKPISYQGGVWKMSAFFAVFACAYSFLPFKIPTIGSKTLLASAFFFAGYAYRSMQSNMFKNKYLGIIFLIMTMIVSIWFIGSMDSTHFDILLYYAIALMGTFAIVNIVFFIPKSVRPVFDYIGSNTLYILTFHFLCFKLVSLIKIRHLGLEFNRLSDFPVIGVSNDIYWIFYSIVGVSLSLLLLKVWQLLSSSSRFQRINFILDIKNKSIKM